MKGDFNADVRFPEEIKLDLTANPSYLSTGDAIDLSGGLTINWNQSVNSANQSVGIAVTYRAADSQSANPNLPANVDDYFTITPDDGVHTIPASELSHFPTNSVIVIAVARGNFDTLTSEKNDDSVVVNCITYSASRPLSVQ